MSTEHHNHGQTNGERPQHADVSFEATDVRSLPIFKFLAYLGITVIASFILSVGIYKGLKNYWTSSYEAPAPMRDAGPHFPPDATEAPQPTSACPAMFARWPSENGSKVPSLPSSPRMLATGPWPTELGNR